MKGLRDNKKAEGLSLSKLAELLIIVLVIVAFMFFIFDTLSQDAPDIISTPSQKLAIEKCEISEKGCNIEVCTEEMVDSEECGEEEFKRWEMWEEYFKQCDNSDIDDEKKEGLGCRGKLYKKFEELNGDRMDVGETDETDTYYMKSIEEIERGGQIKLSRDVKKCVNLETCYPDELPGDRYLKVRPDVWDSLREVHKDIRRTNPFIINSAHRSRLHNKDVNGSTNSRHLDGIAIDVSTRGWGDGEKVALMCSARRHGFNGIGVSILNNFIHIDKRPARTVWSYNKRDWDYLNMNEFRTEQYPIPPCIPEYLYN